MGQISKTTKSNEHKDRRPKSEPNLRLQETITEISVTPRFPKFVNNTYKSEYST